MRRVSCIIWVGSNWHYKCPYKQKAAAGDDIPIDDLEVFENVAYVMALHADATIPATIEEWLDGFEMFSIYEVLPQILELWGENMKTQVKSKKG